ncbi:MAG: S-adenosylmethionine:tRNA ribosyltransferase-isomerase [Saprospiraceae bacterium]|nr:S-adenosylmethionine:tRNA ribosyltransferase-isomerase [Saprospiraceae bacterium]
MSVQNLKIEDFTYSLPDERIARYPLAERDASKLLIYKNGAIETSHYRQIDEQIAENALILFNNTRVIPARLTFYRASGAAIEIFCLEPVGDIASEMTRQGRSVWQCLVGNAKRWKPNETLTLTGNGFKVEANLTDRSQGSFVITFCWTPSPYNFAEVLSAVGATPLPPYLNREAQDNDRDRYQTIYAQFDGSVAAPTAGLHFTEGVFQRFGTKNIATDYVTLHVGAGTFKPVKSETIGEHIMHSEYFDVPKNVIQKIRQNIGNQLISVGTTTLRTLESLFLLGVKLVENPHLKPEDWHIKQWDAYAETVATTPVAEAFDALLNALEEHQLTRVVAKTQLLIAPPYQIRTIDALVTNFHQPQSTLLLLVAALVGDDWRRIYQHALANDFRFLSYGDGSILFKK